MPKNIELPIGTTSKTSILIKDRWYSGERTRADTSHAEHFPCVHSLVFILFLTCVLRMHNAYTFSCVHFGFVFVLPRADVLLSAHCVLHNIRFFRSVIDVLLKFTDTSQMYP
jgi:hypothetical protein